MTINEYQALAMRTLNPVLGKRDILINGVMGLCGESGEAIDIVKKHLAQGHELDREALIKELGDVAWYLAETAHALDVPLEDVMEQNIAKLKARYPEGFETKKSVHRTEELRIERAAAEDFDSVFALYRSLIGTPYSTWTEEYPTREIIMHDLEENDVFVMRDEDDRIVAAIVSIEVDDVDDLAPWYEDVKRWIMFVRLGVAADKQGCGIARRMLAHAMEQARRSGYDGVRFFVGPKNIPAQRSYGKLGFDICGEADHYGEHWLCYQKRLAPQ